MLNTDKPSENNVSSDNDQNTENLLFTEGQLELDITNQLIPPEDVWFEIEQRLSNLENEKKSIQHRKKLKAGYWLASTAASVFFVATGWLIWGNYVLERQLENSLLVNYQLEEQLNSFGKTAFSVSNSFLQIIEIDKKLKEDNSTDIELRLLKERENMIKKMLIIRKEGEYEYSI